MDSTPPEPQNVFAPSPRSTGELIAPTRIANAPTRALEAQSSRSERLIMAGEEIIFIAAIIGAVALGLMITDYFKEHRYIAAYLIAYIGFRFAELIIGDDQAHIGEPADAHARRTMTQLVVLLLFAAAPFERTYFYGGEPAGWAGALGLLLELGGLWLVLGARIQLHFFSADRNGREQAVLVKTGFFRYIRHPVYAGVLLVLLGWPIVFAAPIVAVLTLIIGGIIARRQIRDDEAILAARFGEEFEQYRRTSDALLPSIW